MKDSSETRFDEAFWSDRYASNTIGWDLGKISDPLKAFADHLKDKGDFDLKILIPGAGNAYEAEYFHQLGFKNVSVVDISQEACKSFLDRAQHFPKERVIHGDFFNHGEQYDLIIEQTFFCALDPGLREAYVDKMYDLLKEDGRLVGLLFDDPNLPDGPPFSGVKKEYEALFSKKFNIVKMETAYNSIKPRAGRELWIELNPIHG